MKRQIIIGYKDVFCDNMPDFASLLTGVSKDLLLNIARIFLSKNCVYLKEYLQSFFSPDNEEFANCIYKKVINAAKLDIDDYAIVNTRSSLRFYERVSAMAADKSNTITDDVIIEQVVFKAYLICNQEISDFDDEIMANLKNNDPLRLCRLVISASLNYHSLINFSIARELYVQTYKACCLFKFLEFEQPNILSEFVKTFNCDNWKDYLCQFYQLICPTLVAFKDKTSMTLRLKHDDEYDKNKAFLDKLSHVTIDDDEDVDFRSLRATPIYREDDEYKSTMHIFVVDQLYNGLYFRLNDINSKLRLCKDFKSYLGNEFTENTLFIGIMNSIFQNKTYIQLSDPDMRAKGAIEPSDYYVRNGNKVFLFEIKDTLLKAETISSNDINTIESDLKNKLYRSQSGKPKALLQLIENIKKLLNQEATWDINYKHNRLQIHPILVLSNNVFSCLGINILINTWFMNELKNVISETQLQQVNPLVIVTIDSLIVHREFLRKEASSLNKILKDYTSLMTEPKGALHSTVKNKEKYIDNHFIPFDLYLNRINNFDYNSAIIKMLKEGHILPTESELEEL